jgi:hypothetical protein
MLRVNNLRRDHYSAEGSSSSRVQPSNDRRDMEYQVQGDRDDMITEFRQSLPRAGTTSYFVIAQLVIRP